VSKIGVGVITCNRVDFLKKCIDSIPLHKIDEHVIINDGDRFPVEFTDNNRKILIIEHITNAGVGKSKNDALEYLLSKDCDHIFLIEDDIIIKDENVFDEYIRCSEITGIKHLNFCLHGEDNKVNGSPHPKKIIDYKDIKISLYHNIYGAFSYYHKDVIDEIGLMDEEYINAMEHVDHTMAAIKAGFHPPFRWFADLEDSDNWLDEQDRGHGESTIRRGNWMDNFRNGVERFKSKFSIDVCNPHEKCDSMSTVIEYLRSVKP